MHKRKFLAFAASLCSALILSACGKGDDFGDSITNIGDINDVVIAMRYDPQPGTVGTQYLYVPYYRTSVSIDSKFEVINGALPAGVNLNSGNGELYGTPTQAGRYYFTVRVRVKGRNGFIDDATDMTVRN